MPVLIKNSANVLFPTCVEQRAEPEAPEGLLLRKSRAESRLIRQVTFRAIPPIQFFCGPEKGYGSLPRRLQVHYTLPASPLTNGAWASINIV